MLLFSLSLPVKLGCRAPTVQVGLFWDKKIKYTKWVAQPLGHGMTVIMMLMLSRCSAFKLWGQTPHLFLFMDVSCALISTLPGPYKIHNIYWMLNEVTFCGKNSLEKVQTNFSNSFIYSACVNYKLTFCLLNKPKRSASLPLVKFAMYNILVSLSV